MREPAASAARRFERFRRVLARGRALQRGLSGLRQCARRCGSARWGVARLAAAAVVLCAWGCSGGDEAAGAARPALVVIVADDLPYERLGFVGYTRVATPSIDSIAREGTWFEQAYVSSPVCAPTRAGLLTGRQPARFGYEGRTGTVPEQISHDIGVDPRERLLFEVVRDAGYRTAAIGKWHLGYNEKYRPTRRGVDVFFGFLAGFHDYFRWDVPESERAGGAILRGDEKARGSGYITDAFTREAVRFIHDNAGSPFFLYLAYPNVHGPIAVPPRYVGVGADEIDESLAALDDGVGQVLAALREAGIERDTLVVFINDNGGKEGNAPFRGRKTELYEGGIRVAMAMRWPARLPAGQRYGPPVIQLDLFPTLVAAAGAALPDDRVIDGVDLLPWLGAEGAPPPGVPHTALYFRYPPRGRAARVSEVATGPESARDWKLIEPVAGRVELYDLAHDVGERHDLASEHPEVVREVHGALDRWAAEVDAERVHRRKATPSENRAQPQRAE